MSNQLLEIEKAINSLSLDEQKWLLHRLTEQIQQKSTNILKEDTLKEQLETMANDPDIQAEIALINQEFMITEMDGID
jgi:hypothetical protein